MSTRTALAIALLCTTSTSAFAQTDEGSSAAAAKPASAAQATATTAPTTPASVPPAIPKGIEVPAGFVLGVEDELQITFWKDQDMSVDKAVVTPDGKISLPLINEVQAAGLTPDQLRLAILEAAKKFVDEPTVGVTVKAINSRRVYIEGQINKRGPYALIQPMTVVQLIAIAGGPMDFANTKAIRINRTENGQTKSILFNYKEYMKGKGLETNIQLKPGDIVLIPE